MKLTCIRISKNSFKWISIAIFSEQVTNVNEHQNCHFDNITRSRIAMRLQELWNYNLVCFNGFKPTFHYSKLTYFICLMHKFVIWKIKIKMLRSLKYSIKTHRPLIWETLTATYNSLINFKHRKRNYKTYQWINYNPWS